MKGPSDIGYGSARKRGTGSQSELEDRALMQMVASGDREAYDKLYRKHKKVVEAAILRKLYNIPLAIEAADMVQDTFHLVWRKAALYKPQGSVRSWLCKIAENRCIDIIRQGIARQNRETDCTLTTPPQGGEAVEERPVDDFKHFKSPANGDKIKMTPGVKKGDRAHRYLRWKRGAGPDTILAMFRSLGSVIEDENI